MGVARIDYFLGRKCLIFPFSYKIAKIFWNWEAETGNKASFHLTALVLGRIKLCQGKRKTDTYFSCTVADEGHALSEGGKEKNFFALWLLSCRGVHILGCSSLKFTSIIVCNDDDWGSCAMYSVKPKISL